MPSPKSSKAVKKASSSSHDTLVVPQQLDLLWPSASAGLLAGVDEAGRGPLAGPVVAAAVILDDQQPIIGLADSKKLTARQRERLFDEIRAKALCCCIAEATVEEIDEINILQATMLAMRRAVEGLRSPPCCVSVRALATQSSASTWLPACPNASASKARKKGSTIPAPVA